MKQSYKKDTQINKNIAQTNYSAANKNAQITGGGLSAFFAENRGKILEFGEYFLEKLSDEELLNNLAEKDLEKLARIFKLMFDKSFAEEARAEKGQNRILDEILGIFKEDRIIE